MQVEAYILSFVFIVKDLPVLTYGLYHESLLTINDNCLRKRNRDEKKYCFIIKKIKNPRNFTGFLSLESFLRLAYISKLIPDLWMSKKIINFYRSFISFY